MKNNESRRAFFKKSLSGVTASLIPTSLATSKVKDKIDENKKEPSNKRLYNGKYQGQNLNRIAFPIGGLGAGMFCMEGTGAISHMSIRHKPDIFNEPSLFAAITVKGFNNGAKVLEAPVPDWKKFGMKDAGNGATGATTGLPRFRKAELLVRFPFATLDLSDLDLPLKVRLNGWSPFIPGDENNSGLPVGALEYTFTNSGKNNIESVFSFNTKNFLKIDQGKNYIDSTSNGFILHEDGTKEKPFKTDFAIFSDDPETIINHSWFRGGWWDPLTMAWNAVKEGKPAAISPVEKDAPGASLYIPFDLAPGKSRTIKIMMAWYCPETDFTVGKMGVRKENCDAASGCCNSPSDIQLDKYDLDFNGKFHKPWYSSQYASIHEIITYWRNNYEELKHKTTLFKNAFYSSTLAPEVMEAVAANLTILKSPTIMRQYNGRLWSFEGCGDSWGCCHGSCTHVWNYAQAIPHLFPALERSLRHTEFCESQNEEGHQNFRSVLPISPASHDFHAAADGQLGGIIKAFRDWRISGDSNWLTKMYPMIAKSMDYCIFTWDPRHRGAIEEPHHNTYDIEFWGPDGMHNSFYIAALQAISSMGRYLSKDTILYEKLLAQAIQIMESELYNGEYFIQKIQTEGLTAKNPALAQSFGGEYSQEAQELLMKEGPKYQYGNGCLSDGILGFWMARICGLPDVSNLSKIKSHLMAIHKYNLKTNLSQHANPQRPSFALGDDGGLLLCSWPKGGKLSLPFVYSDEVWTGIEHQVASHLMLTGQVQQGLEIVRISRNRYDGKVRNPFNEYECGHWYARALSSYSYLQALTGTRYDSVDKTLFIDSKIGDFTCFLSTESGFGTVKQFQNKISVQIASGKIDIVRINNKGILSDFN